MDDRLDQQPAQSEAIGPTVLDWLKSILRGKPISIPEEAGAEGSVPVVMSGEESSPAEETEMLNPLKLLPAHFRLPAAIFLGMIAQFLLERREGDPRLAISLYVIAGVLTFWAFWRQDFQIPLATSVKTPFTTPHYRRQYLLIAMFASGMTFVTAGNNLFDLPTVFLWVLSIAAILLAFWEGESPLPRWIAKVRAWIPQPQIEIKIAWWTVLFFAAFGLAVFFRFYRLDQVPPEMVSDHAEKLLDVLDVRNGLPSIFFPRNTGREALQFYMAAATDKLFNTGITHLTLKIGTAAAGVITLIYIYLIGKELSNRRVGLVALLLAGVAYWPNVISRIGLRFPLYPLFVAPVFYHIIKGIQKRSRNDFILAGFFIGAGLHGYSPSRVIPLAVVFAILLYLMHREARGSRRNLLTLLVITGIVAIVVTMPLIRVAVDRPDEVIYRMATRYGSAERPLPGPALGIFLSNVWNGLRMFAWDNGEVWVNSIPHRPALDWLTAAFFHLGIIMLWARYLKTRNWVDLFLLLSIPILQLPSTLSLAFPAENPALNRAAGAIVPVFLIAALAFDVVPRWLKQQWHEARMERFGFALVVILFLLVARINYNLTFVEYQNLYRQSAWNTSEAGQVIRSYAENIGSYESAHVVAYPHWVDTRLVAMNAGIPTKDYAIAPENLATLLEEPGPHLLLLHPDDEQALAALYELFPNLSVRHWPNEIPGKDFVIAFAPASGEQFSGRDVEP